MRSSPFLTNARKQLKIKAISNFEQQAHVTPWEERNLSMVYHGLLGSFSESVVLGTFPNAIEVPCNELETAISLVENQTVDYAVMPLDPRYPTFKNNYDLLLNN
ncbi:hypothetical protein FH972_006290 [Carpinus fangiana]|uniref:Prephenate dehydratase domain-containing protein n=1 Tax=Carpinus fangiana TaxID=176857 RepID=A0A5N6QUT0_9ROSI|nr:hypothetical protein FH972_006290 [Carpinus fangiana]